MAGAQTGLPPSPPPTQQAWPSGQLPGVQGGGVHRFIPPPPPPNSGSQVLPSGQSVSSVQTSRWPSGHSPSVPGAAQAGTAPPPPRGLQHNSPSPQLAVVQAAGPQVPLLHAKHAFSLLTERQPLAQPAQIILRLGVLELSEDCC